MPWRHQYANVLPHELGRLVAEGPLHHGVHIFDDSSFVNRDDRVDGGFEQSPQALFVVFGEQELPPKLELVCDLSTKDT